MFETEKCMLARRKILNICFQFIKS